MDQGRSSTTWLKATTALINYKSQDN
jgi:hypothetical protein